MEKVLDFQYFLHDPVLKMEKCDEMRTFSRIQSRGWRNPLIFSIFSIIQCSRWRNCDEMRTFLQNSEPGMEKLYNFRGFLQHRVARMEKMNIIMRE